MVSIENDPQTQENFQQAKQHLLDQYLQAGLKLISNTDDGFIVEYKDTAFAVIAEDIHEYAQCLADQDTFKNAPAECSLLSNDYREQIVQPLDPIRWRHMPPLEMGFLFGDPDTDDAYTVVGAASMTFVNYFRFEPVYLSICLERMARMSAEAAPLDIRQGLYRPPTIQVYQLAQKSVKAALNASSQIIQYCLFELAYLKHLPVGLAEEWPPRRRLRDHGFYFDDTHEGHILPMPPAEFNADVVQFYQLGLSSNIPVMQFWSFYQVLEYYFVRVSDADLHQQLANRLRDPRFKPTSTQLDRVVQDVLDHMEAADMLHMLTAVLEKYVDETELITFIRAYQRYLGDELYTKRRRLFGEDVQVKLSSGTVFDNVARIILAIRHTLLYSPDRFSRTARNIGFDQLTDTIRPEIPLMKYLAERVIIGSAS